MIIGIGIGTQFRRRSGAPFGSDLAVNLRESELNNLLVPSVVDFDGALNYATSTSYISADEVEFRVKTTSTARMGIVCVDGYNTIQLSNNVILAGGASVTGNAAAFTYTDGNWHTIKLVKTATANVYQIYADGNLLSASSSGSWRLATATHIGQSSNNSLRFMGQLNYVKLITGGEVTNEWSFNMAYSIIYDNVGSNDLNWFGNRSVIPDAGVIDYISVYGANLNRSDSNELYLSLYKNGTPRDLPFLHEIIYTSIEGIVPSVSCFLNLTGHTLFNRADTTIYSNFARVGMIDPYIWPVEALNRITLNSWLNNGHIGRIYPMGDHSSIEATRVTRLMGYTSDYSGADQLKILKYTKDDGYIVGEDSNGYKTYFISPARENIITELPGGLTTRLVVNEDLADVFELSGFEFSSVALTPANFTAGDIALITDLTSRGHEVGFWSELGKQAAIKLYNNDWADDFLALDAEYEGQTDEYGSDIKGIQEVLELGGVKYLGLTTQVRHKTDDIEIELINGTRRVHIDHTFPGTAATRESFVIFLTDSSLVPEGLQNKWVYVGPYDDAANIFIIEPYEVSGLAALYPEFVNVGGAKITTSVGVVPDRTARTANGYNVRARYYAYLHAIMAFEAMGLERPYIVGEPRNLVNHDSMSYQPLKDLGYVAGTVDPMSQLLSSYYNTEDQFRYRMAAGDFVGLNTVSEIKDILIKDKVRHKIRPERNVIDPIVWGELLPLLSANNIPVIKLSEAGSLLWDSSWDVIMNVFPDISQDTNTDDNPDGFEDHLSGTTWEISEPNGNIESGYAYFTRSSTGRLFRIEELGALIRGMNNASLYLYGKAGDLIKLAVTCYVQGYEKNVNTVSTASPVSQIVYFEITTSDAWQLCLPDASIIIPSNFVYANITATLTKGGTAGDVRCGQLFIHK